MGWGFLKKAANFAGDAIVTSHALATGRNPKTQRKIMRGTVKTLTKGIKTGNIKFKPKAILTLGKLIKNKAEEVGGALTSPSKAYDLMMSQAKGEHILNKMNNTI